MSLPISLSDRSKIWPDVPCKIFTNCYDLFTQSFCANFCSLLLVNYFHANLLFENIYLEVNSKIHISNCGEWGEQNTEGEGGGSTTDIDT